MKEIEIGVVAESDQFIPYYGSTEAAGADLKANIETTLSILPGKRVLIPTGIKMHIPEGYEVQLRPRSGLALKHGITLLNTPATIDSDYRGEIKIILINAGDEPFIVEPGMRIAQAVLAPVYRMQFTRIEQMTATARGEGGFGHTGL